jgi:hypothetical protein
MKAGWPVIQPRRQPGATVLEKVSRRRTRPSVSMLMYEGTRLSRKSKPELFQCSGRGSPVVRIVTSGLKEVLAGSEVVVVFWEVALGNCRYQ